MTFSIVGLCGRTGQMGCALATSSMGAGGRAPFVAPGVGVVLSQARSDPRLGAVALKSLETGRSAQEALSDMIASTPHSQWRQLAVLDLRGSVASFTGEHCTLERGVQSKPGVIAIGNGLANASVPAAILAGFEASPEKTLADRLIMALEHGMKAGGEAFPLRSASLRVAYPDVPFTPIDLRVDFSDTPIEELRHLWELWEPMADSYIQRCMDPENSPAAASIEGHKAR